VHISAAFTRSTCEHGLAIRPLLTPFAPA